MSMYQFPDPYCGRLYQNNNERQSSADLSEPSHHNQPNQSSETDDNFPAHGEPTPNIGWNTQ